MLDLNLTVASSDSVSDKLLLLSNSQMESSGSFSSSNVTADDDSCSNADDAAFAYTFGILKPNDVGEGSFGARARQVEEDDEGEDNSSKRKTIQLFPVIGTVRSSSGRQCLGLSSSWEANCDGPAEQRIVPLPQQQPAVKKSRRGPRSRSSQYRGVTFYRRTGRWESHIWLVIDWVPNLLENLQHFPRHFSFFYFLVFICSCFLCRDCGKQVYLGMANGAYNLFVSLCEIENLLNLFFL